MTSAKSEVRIKDFEKPITYSIFPHSNITIYTAFRARIRLFRFARGTTLIEIAVIS
jgi:hypothetical protein